jgi:ATP-dependent Clp protease adapter protein ClpS
MTTQKLQEKAMKICNHIEKHIKGAVGVYFSNQDYIEVHKDGKAIFGTYSWQNSKISATTEEVFNEYPELRK